MPTSTPPSHPPSQLCLVLPQRVTNVPPTLQFTLTDRGEARQSGVNHTRRGKKNNRLAMLMSVVSILFVYLKHIYYIQSVCEEFCDGEKGRKAWKYNFWTLLSEQKTLLLQIQEKCKDSKLIWQLTDSDYDKFSQKNRFRWETHLTRPSPAF